MSICVIIAAWNAERTIGRAITSALEQAEVSEVVVVDDASTDGTSAEARAADDGSGRLAVLRQMPNRGPSAARNRALDESHADYIAILDADDYLLPRRFEALLAIPDWDAIADNIAFVPESGEIVGPAPKAGQHDHVQKLTLNMLIAGSISRPDAPRGELGFMKPVIRRAFLRAHGLRYDETLRLSEDFVLYMKMLAANGHFLTTRRCGYVAVERSQSLSGNHTAGDLGALLHAVDDFADKSRLGAPDRAILAHFRARLSANFRHRRLLDDKRQIGLARALARVFDEPNTVPQVVLRVLRDKLAMRRATPAAVPTVRYLFPR